LQRELDAFSREVMGGDFSIREVTKGAFTQARAKLDPEAFKELNEDIVANFYGWGTLPGVARETATGCTRHPACSAET